MSENKAVVATFLYLENNVLKTRLFCQEEIADIAQADFGKATIQLKDGRKFIVEASADQVRKELKMS